MLRSESGSVLANLMVTVAIIAVLLTAITPNFNEAVAKTKDVACKLDVRMVGLATAMRSVDRGEETVSGWKDLVPLYIKEPVKCPHGKPWDWRNGEMRCGMEGK